MHKKVIKLLKKLSNLHIKISNLRKRKR